MAPGPEPDGEPGLVPERGFPLAEEAEDVRGDSARGSGGVLEDFEEELPGAMLRKKDETLPNMVLPFLAGSRHSGLDGAASRPLKISPRPDRGGGTGDPSRRDDYTDPPICRHFES
jgi:hypothetical protein